MITELDEDLSNWHPTLWHYPGSNWHLHHSVSSRAKDALDLGFDVAMSSFVCTTELLSMALFDIAVVAQVCCSEFSCSFGSLDSSLDSFLKN